MGNTKDNGGPAFPIGSGDMRDPQGMTLRDYLAAKIMAALIHAEQHAALTHSRDRMIENKEVGGGGVNSYIDYAHEAYSAADAMLKAREQ